MNFILFIMQYTLSIECKACRDGNHLECHGIKNKEDKMVIIECTCFRCHKGGAK